MPKEGFIIYPRNKGHKPLSEYIPADYRKEIEEAYSVITDSAKASAALSRRLLQTFCSLKRRSSC